MGDMEKKIMGAGMFRRQATADQRRSALRSMLGIAPSDGCASGSSTRNREGDATTEAAHPISKQDTREAANITSPEELCKLIARSDEELKVFRQMDKATLQPRIGTAVARRVNMDTESLLM